MNIDQIREYIVRPVLERLNMGGVNAENLVLGTGLVESGFNHIKQVGGGPALGFFQCEPATYRDIRLYLHTRPEILADVKSLIGSDLMNEDALMWNFRLSTAICRIHYWRKPGAIPDTIEGQGEYWKKHYNTRFGAGTVERYVRAARVLK